MPISPVVCPKNPLSRSLDVEVNISRPQTELATDMTMICFLTPDVSFSDGGNDRVRFYSSFDALTEDVPANGSAYWAGNAFFSRSERPATLCVGQVFLDPTPAVLRGGAVALPALKGITNGGFDISVNGDIQSVRGLDFSEVQSVQGVATVLGAAMTGVQVTSDADGVVLKTVASGDGASFSYAQDPSSDGREVHYIVSSKSNKNLVEELLTISDGSFNVVYEGNAYTVSGLDFTHIRNEFDAAEVIEYGFLSAGFVPGAISTFGGFVTIVKDDYAPNGEPVVYSGFSACTPAGVGTDISSLLNLTADANPLIGSKLEQTTATHAHLDGGDALDISAVAALGKTSITISGYTGTVDFSGVTSLSQVVAALNAVTAFKDVYEFNSTEPSALDASERAVSPYGIYVHANDNEIVTYVEGRVGDVLKLSATTACSILPVGIPAYTPVAATDVSGLLALTESLAVSNTIGYTPKDIAGEADLVATAARCAGSPIYGWILDAYYRDHPDQKTFSDWIEARDPAIFIACTNSPQAYNTGDTGNIGYYCYNKGYKRTGVIYHNNPQVYPDMSYLACALSVDYAAEASAITLKFKQLDGIEPSPLTETQLNALTSRNINCYTYIGNSARTVREGTQALDTWFTDSLVNLDNFKEELQVEVYNVFLRNKKIPYTTAGQNMLVSAATKICKRYVTNGTFAARDEETNGNETGFETKPAYAISPASISGATASDRAARLAPPISIVCYEAGAFHKVSLNVSVYN